jgi:hypothetical protein
MGTYADLRRVRKGKTGRIRQTYIEREMRWRVDHKVTHSERNPDLDAGHSHETFTSALPTTRARVSHQPRVVLDLQ